MTFSKLFSLGVALAVVLAAINIFFSNALNGSSIAVRTFEWVIVSAVTISIVRRLGVLNYLEAFLVIGLWFFLRLLFDFLFTSQVLSIQLFTEMSLWLNYLVMMIMIFVFHKKRHVEIRRQMGKK